MYPGPGSWRQTRARGLTAEEVAVGRRLTACNTRTQSMSPTALTDAPNWLNASYNHTDFMCYHRPTHSKYVSKSVSKAQLTRVAVRDSPTTQKWPPKLTIGQVRLSCVRRQTVPEQRCCRSECSIDKRTLCATDDQCSSVGRTQSSDIGNESADRQPGSLGQTPMNKRDDLVADALEASATGEAPMWDVVTSSCASDQPGCSILHWL